ncbi:hypothetical protein SS1G_13848 [Sclerotinia sclerotiorum 1980 UF-70]|uniref:FAD/NAD(P)-binding domain-containing protein n=1 Tax=Sclerotinia sclerotiorum (strain ATCC 18683 / 1980 / Ss-1) TaxID=665079 RepID=A7F8B7_SCLS1|nr:hypothetical protein SS1G_13848 [Sclerotinia sclerotiorum 1980 UF-70]EDN98988.1 hypothetical protein SS1G_13848 [Sclerotinia sclerotiorum 1980 UF-70]
MVSVAIIGAGPAGLVAAKTLLHSSSEGPAPTVTVFEQGTNVGGLWAVESNCNGIINPGMNTNLSKFTVCFSDLAWDSLELQPPANIYPQAWQVNRYLNTYAAKYIPAGVIFLQTYVKVVEYLQTPFDQEKRWKITTITRAGDNWTEREDIFDYLIIASGFFSKARQKPFSCHSTTTENDDCLPTILHSSQYRQLSDLSLTNQPPTMGKILVIGGSHSGGEVASLIAMQMSDARHSPVGSGAQPLDIIHAMPHPLVSIPSFVRTGNENCPTFMQLDSRLYDLSSRPDDPISFNFGFTNAEKRKKLKDTLAMLMSGTAHAQDDNLVVQADRDKFGAPYAVVGDKYVEFVRSGAIKQVLGRITQVEQPLLARLPK